MLRFVLFDLDDTLYPAQCGLWAAIGARIDQYMVEELGLAAHATQAMRRHYLETFGTTLNGLRREYSINPLDFLSYVHDVPVSAFVGPNVALDAMLARLPMTKVVFTNADRPHAQRVLACLGIARHFARIIDIHALEFDNKPSPGAYARALGFLGADPSECLFVDDAARNLRPAQALGMTTVLVGAHAAADEQPPAGVDFQIQNILELEGVVAEVSCTAPARVGRPG